MTDAAAYPSCKHGRKIYEHCEECLRLAHAGIGHGFIRADAPPSSNERLSVALDTIARTVQGWLDFQERERIEQGYSVDADVHLRHFPEWPSRGTLQNWVSALKEASRAHETGAEQIARVRDWFADWYGDLRDRSYHELANIIGDPDTGRAWKGPTGPSGSLPRLEFGPFCGCCTRNKITLGLPPETEYSPVKAACDCAASRVLHEKTCSSLKTEGQSSASSDHSRPAEPPSSSGSSGEADSFCETCGTQLAFEGDVCGLCNPVAQP